MIGTTSEKLNVAVDPAKLATAKVVPFLERIREVISEAGLPDSVTIRLVIVNVPELGLLILGSATVTPAEPLKSLMEDGGAAGPWLT